MPILASGGKYQILTSDDDVQGRCNPRNEHDMLAMNQSNKTMIDPPGADTADEGRMHHAGELQGHLFSAVDENKRH